MKKLGIVALGTGFLLTAFTGFNLVFPETVIDAGPVKVTQDKNHYLTWPPLVGVVVMVVGGFLLFAGSKKQ